MTRFQERVHAALREIPRGRVTTYKEIARRLDTSPRAVGQACRNNPYAPDVPCHRVVAADGSIGGYAGETQGDEVVRKIGLLRDEGVRVEQGSIVDFGTVCWGW